jgi:hypothetical protein
MVSCKKKIDQLDDRALVKSNGQNTRPRLTAMVTWGAYVSLECPFPPQDVAISASTIQTYCLVK